MSTDPALSGSTDPAEALAVARYRELYAAAERAGPVGVGASRIASNWRAIGVELDAPKPGLVERFLRRVGLPEQTGRLLMSTPALRRGWYVATGVAMLFVLAAASPERGAENLTTFLMVAPLVPVLGVALAYGPLVDPMYEVSVATPVSGLRLVVLRSAAVAGVALPVVGLTAAALPAGPMTAGMWLVPCVVLSALCLALTTFTTPRASATIVASGWLLVSSGLGRWSTGDLGGFGVTTQIVLSVIGVVAVAVTFVRRTSFDVAA